MARKSTRRSSTKRKPKERSTDGRLISVPAGGRILGLSPATTWRYVYAGIIPTLKFSDSKQAQRFVDRRDLDILIAELKAGKDVKAIKAMWKARAA